MILSRQADEASKSPTGNASVASGSVDHWKPGNSLVADSIRKIFPQLTIEKGIRFHQFSDVRSGPLAIQLLLTSIPREPFHLRIIRSLFALDHCMNRGRLSIFFILVSGIPGEGNVTIDRV